MCDNECVYEGECDCVSVCVSDYVWVCECVCVREGDSVTRTVSVYGVRRWAVRAVWMVACVRLISIERRACERCWWQGLSDSSQVTSASGHGSDGGGAAAPLLPTPSGVKVGWGSLQLEWPLLAQKDCPYTPPRVGL